LGQVDAAPNTPSKAATGSANGLGYKAEDVDRIVAERKARELRDMAEKPLP
jgi:hypothetical protein